VAKNAVQKKKEREKIDPSRMSPKVAAGLTVDVPVTQAMEMNPVMPVRSGVEVVRDFNAAQRMAAADPRDDGVHFVAERSGDNEIVIETQDGRKMEDVDVALPAEHIQQIKAGYRCIQCYEKFDSYLPPHCPVCNEPTAGQPMRALHEFDDERNMHLGPRKPMREIVEEREVRIAQREFLDKLKAGHSPMKGLRHFA
jgi:hypothetical protein